MMNLRADDFSIQAFVAQILLHLEKVDHPDLHKIFHGMLEKSPPLNHPLETKPPFFQQELEDSIQGIPAQTMSLKPGVEYLANRVYWNDASRGVPEFTVRGYSFAEIIGKSGAYLHDSMRLGLYVQAPSVDYPAHAHDAEEFYLILNGHAEWQIDDESHHAEAGSVFHHPPTAGHRMITSDQPLLALWMWTGAIEGRYWFVGHEEIDCQLK